MKLIPMYFLESLYKLLELLLKVSQLMKDVSNLIIFLLLPKIGPTPFFLTKDRPDL